MNLGSNCFQDALRLVRTVLYDRLNQTAQATLANEIICVAAGLRSASQIECLTLSDDDIEEFLSLFNQIKGFEHLDILTIGSDDTNYVIHRELLLQDINEYISNSPIGLHRLFVNVDYRLEKPEIMPENRCQLLEEYVEEVLRPEIEARVISWQREGFTRNCVPAPTKISNVTLSGWLLNFPVTYVLPRSCPREKEQRRLHHESSDDDEDDNECGRNCLADRELVVTHVQLEPSKGVKGLKDHCLMSFSYPAHLAEFCKHSSNHTTESPCKLKSSRRRSYPSYDDDELEDHDDDNDVYVDASDVAYRSRSGSMANSHESINSKSTPTVPSVVGANYKEPDPMFAGDNSSKTNKSSTEYPDDDPYQTQTHLQQTHQPRPQLQTNGRSISLSDHIPQQSSNTRVKSIVMEHEPVPVAEYCGRVGSELPLPSNEDVYTAGRSFLQQMHNRFHDQRVWKAWEVGQQNVTLPVVGLR